MHLDSLTTWTTIRRLAVVLIALWWGGLNCLTGCLFAPSATATGVSHCAMSTEGDCCLLQAGSKDSPAGATIASPSTALQPLACCSLEAISAEIKRNVRALDGTALTPVLNWRQDTPAREIRTALPDRWARLPDRGGSYLLHCVFLI
jgi:hypothetical protein